MGRTSGSTIRAARIPKHLVEIGMSPEQYFDLKVHIKSIVLPGTPAFEGKRFRNKNMYRQWLDRALQEIGPRFFPKGGKGLVWPVDYQKICGAVDQVIQVLGYSIRRDHRKKTGELRDGGGEEKNKMEVVEDGHRGGRLADNNNVDGDVLMVDGEFAEESQEKGVIMMDRSAVDKKAMEAEMGSEMEFESEMESEFDVESEMDEEMEEELLVAVLLIFCMFNFSLRVRTRGLLQLL